MILGAPRSGTSLLQKIVREHDGFSSVAKESGFIWRKYCHPALQDWRCEGCPDERIDDAAVEGIRGQFQRYALSSKAWRRASGFDVLRYQRSPMLAPVLRLGYFGLAGVSHLIRRLAPKREDDADRLVDKSVHSALFLNLMDRVFPDACYIHIVRDGRKTVPSMIDGWLNPDRFFTYNLPGGLQIPDYPFQDWNFALPSGWEAYRDRQLADVVAFQWTRLQQSILTYFDAPGFENRLLRIRLEDLVSEPEPVLRRLTDVMGVPWSDYWERLSHGMPTVNARPGDRKKQTSAEVSERMERMSDTEAVELQRVNEAIGYGE
ncbi:hypothetical protein PC39_02180 [Salinisphaera sp. PC39]|uniref:sulfotransferase family protein n=1 Tax=Salinisphaera sp. PC39 TaxID=1304156 RepID=UPI003341C8E2